MSQTYIFGVTIRNKITKFIADLYHKLCQEVLILGGLFSQIIPLRTNINNPGFIHLHLSTYNMINVRNCEAKSQRTNAKEIQLGYNKNKPTTSPGIPNFPYRHQFSAELS